MYTVFMPNALGGQKRLLVARTGVPGAVVLGVKRGASATAAGAELLQLQDDFFCFPFFSFPPFLSRHGFSV